MSTAVEQAFSQGQQLLHFTHNQLSLSSIHAFGMEGKDGNGNT